MKLFLFFFFALMCVGAQAQTKQEYLSLTRKAEQKYAIPVGLLGGICAVESHWNPNAVGSKGEIGLCQIKVDTAKMFCPTCATRAPVLYQGMKSEKVMLVKNKLIQKKYYSGPLDDNFDLQLHIAVSAFQRNNKLGDDGIVGNRTWEKLFGRKMTGNFLMDQLYDAETNIDYAARYLADLMKELETRDYELLATAYNAGQAGKSVDYIMKVRMNVRKQSTNPPVLD